MVIKVKPWGKGQGDFVWIEEEDFDKEIHEKIDGGELDFSEESAEEESPRRRGRKPKGY